MTYTIISDEGAVLRNSDGKQVAPAFSAQDPDYLAYVAWCNAGNQPAIRETRDPEYKARAAEREAAKIVRQEAVNNITVTTSSGKTFDGNEASQGRIDRKIRAMQATGAQSTDWVLADNLATQVTLAELIEALALAVAEQDRLWVI